MTRRGGLTRNRIFTDGLLSYIKRPGRAGRPGRSGGAGGSFRSRGAGGSGGPGGTGRTSGSGRPGGSLRSGGTCSTSGTGGSGGPGHGDQGEIGRGARCPGGVILIHLIEGAVVIEHGPSGVRGVGDELCDGVQPRSRSAGGAGGTSGSGRAGGAGGRMPAWENGILTGTVRRKSAGVGKAEADLQSAVLLHQDPVDQLGYHAPLQPEEIALGEKILHSGGT